MTTTYCSSCGLVYDDFRTGFTYQEVYSMLWSADDDSATWRYKGRHIVLGLWRQIKLSMWEDHVSECEMCKRAPMRLEVDADLALLASFAPIHPGVYSSAVPF